MAPWTLVKVNYLPMILGLVMALGLIICFAVSVLRGDVSPYMPFISETGGKFPEAGIFSIFLYFTVIVGLTSIFVRCMIIEEVNRSIDRSIEIVNRIALIVGFISLMGMMVVAAYPMTSIEQAHSIGANILFFGAVIYAILQTALSFRMYPFYNGKTICVIRLIISILSGLALISLTVLASFAIPEWGSGNHTHWTGSKTPEDKGFDLMVASSVSEWIMAILFICYYLTFIYEFSKVCIHFRVQMLVLHFDDAVNRDTTVSERTPLTL